MFSTKSTICLYQVKCFIGMDGISSVGTVTLFVMHLAKGETNWLHSPWTSPETVGGWIDSDHEVTEMMPEFLTHFESITSRKFFSPTGQSYIRILPERFFWSMDRSALAVAAGCYSARSDSSLVFMVS